MKSFTQATKRLYISTIVFVQIFFYPAAVFADTVDQTATNTGSTDTTTQPAATDTTSSSSPATTPETTTTSPVAPTPAPTTTVASPGPSQPTGADSSTYKYNSTTGMWENGVYGWDPVTKQTKPLTRQSYSYNPATGMWDTTQWVYHPETGTYQPNVVSVSAPPAGTVTSTKSPMTALDNDPLIANTGPNSTNGITDSSTLNGTFNLFYNAAISNTYRSTTQSGDALVQGNTNAGDALSGGANNVANVLNLLQSSWLSQSSDVASFMANIDGSKVGNLFFDPAMLSYKSGLPPNANVDVNIANNGLIQNDINLEAGSGNAEVSDNTNAGNARSGNALAQANIFNLINSAIIADQSFIGLINITGDYNGDILLPAGLIDRALIARTGPGSDNSITQNNTDNLDVNVNATKTISNNVATDATSGAALVNNNTSAGGSESGNTKTNVNTANLVGQNVKGRNALLVFVNVLGNWLGFYSVPGSSNILDTGPGSSNIIDTSGTRNISVNADVNSAIENNVTVGARSGDATVTGNTKAGSARSGDALADVNLLNMIDSSIDVDGFFGVLFINVFGNWFGNFGTPSSHSSTVIGGASMSTPSTTSGGVAAGSVRGAPYSVYNTGGSSGNFVAIGSGSSGGGIASQPASSSVAAATKTAQAKQPNVSNVASSSDLQQQLWVFSGAALIAAAVFFAFDNRKVIISRLRNA